MSVSIEMPCGCEINEAFVITMCLTHSHELLQKKLLAKADHDRFERMLRDAVESAQTQESHDVAK